ncbi:MAG: TolC family protein [Deltaproteobacteria bacterium]|nr:TolC family protein [Deltaproteobacteria bacterium]
MKERQQNLYCVLLLGFLSLLGLPCLLSAQSGEKIYSLGESIEEALANNWSIKAASERIREAEEVKEQAKKEFYPKLSTSYGYTHLSEVTRSAPISLGDFGEIPAYDLNTQDNYQWKMTVKQPLFTGYALISAYELSKLGIDLNMVALESKRLDLALRVKEAYFNILGAQKALEVTTKAVEALESNVKVARSFYNVGMIPINDLLKVEVELSNAEQNRVKAQSGVELAKNAFNAVLARPVLSPLHVEDILVYRPETGNFEEFLSTALKNRPEIRQIDINLLQADQQIRLAKSKFYPEAALNYDYIKEGDEPGVSGSAFHDSSYWQVTAGLTWTFFEWGKTRSAVREKESLKKQLENTRKSIEDGISLDIRKAMLDLEVSAKNIPTTEKAVEQAEENLRVSEERYKAQVTTVTEVLDAQTLLTQARTNYYNALYDHNLARARLRRALGEY